MEREREFKTTTEQWRVMLGYLEEYPVLLKNKFTMSDGDHEKQKHLWESLATQLNSMGSGSRTVAKWQTALGRWKSKTKAKASAIRLDSQRTGGGPLTAPPLNPSEERLMSLMGYKSITGDLNKELGISTRTPTKNVNTLQQPAAGCSKRDSPPPLAPLLCFEHSVEILDDKEDPHAFPPKRNRQDQAAHVEPPKKRVRTGGERTRKFVNMNRMHTDMINKLTNIENNTSIMATALTEISNNIKKYVQYITENPSD